MILKINIPDSSIQKIITVLNWKYPCPMVLSDPNNPESPMIRQYTVTQWAKMLIPRILTHEFKKYNIQYEQLNQQITNINDVLLEE